MIYSFYVVISFEGITVGLSIDKMIQWLNNTQTNKEPRRPAARPRRATGLPVAKKGAAGGPNILKNNM